MEVPVTCSLGIADSWHRRFLHGTSPSAIWRAALAPIEQSAAEPLNFVQKILKNHVQGSTFAGVDAFFAGLMFFIPLVGMQPLYEGLPTKEPFYD